MKTILQQKCPFCGHIAKETGRIEIDGELWIDLNCGHTLIKDALLSEDITITSSDGRTPFPFQMTTAKFLEDADCNGLCLHEQGLGKTVIECLLLRRNPQLLPALIVCKSGLRAQWFAEIMRWTGMAAQVITSSRDQVYLDYFPIIIVSIDTLRILRPDIDPITPSEEAIALMSGKPIRSVKPLWSDELIGKFKHIAVDESQKIKNEGSSRTRALRLIAARANEGQKARVICYSGTNIEKHAGEYFVTLNLTRPELFPSQANYILRYCDVSPMTGKIGGLKDPEHFREMTKDFIIRYKREQVLPELPRIFRQFRLAELEGGDLKAYQKVVKEFQEAMEENEVMLPTDILGYLSKMRHITGVAKVDAAVDFVEEFLLETEDTRKLVIFLHHKQAAAILDARISLTCKEAAYAPPLQLHSGLNLDQRTEVVEAFKRPENRILIASTQASGEGLNLQFCSDCLMMERQWNPAQEEQAEGRFPRPGSTADRVNVTYLIAAGSIDDFLTEIVEQKRRNVAQVLDGQEITWDETSLIMELAKVIRDKGMMRWSIR